MERLESTSTGLGTWNRLSGFHRGGRDSEDLLGAPQPGPGRNQTKSNFPFSTPPQMCQRGSWRIQTGGSARLQRVAGHREPRQQGLPQGTSRSLLPSFDFCWSYWLWRKHRKPSFLGSRCRTSAMSGHEPCCTRVLLWFSGVRNILLTSVVPFSPASVRRAPGAGKVPR